MTISLLYRPWDFHLRTFMSNSGIHCSSILLRMFRMLLWIKDSEPQCTGGQREATQFPANQEAGCAQGLQKVNTNCRIWCPILDRILTETFGPAWENSLQLVAWTEWTEWTEHTEIHWAHFLKFHVRTAYSLRLIMRCLGASVLKLHVSFS